MPRGQNTLSSNIKSSLPKSLLSDNSLEMIPVSPPIRLKTKLSKAKENKEMLANSTRGTRTLVADGAGFRQCQVPKGSEHYSLFRGKLSEKCPWSRASQKHYWNCSPVPPASLFLHITAAVSHVFNSVSIRLCRAVEWLCWIMFSQVM